MRVSTPVGELHVEDIGQGPTVVLWHAVLHHGGMWGELVASLRERYRILNVDAPGHGRSARLDRPIDLPACAEAIVAVLDAAEVRSAVAVGHSWGGMVAQTLALDHRDRIDAVALLDSTCVRDSLIRRVQFQTLALAAKTMGVTQVLLDQIEPMFFSEAARRDLRDQIEDWRNYALRLDPSSVEHAVQCMLSRADRRRELRKLQVPALVLVGELDAIYPPRHAKVLAGTLAGKRYEVLPGAGHLTPLERPTEVGALLGAFLDQLAGR